MENRPFVVALLLVAAFAGLLAWWIVRSWRRTGHTFQQAFLYLVNDFFTRVLWRTKVSGSLPVADSQGALIVCNHSSGIDPLLIQLCTKRVVHWMVAREYFEMLGIRWVFKHLQSICVNRAGIDTAATKRSIRLLQQGELVGLFPEGRVNVSKDLLLPGRPGAALIALKARVPVIPCYVSGAPYDGSPLGSFFLSANARVTVGPLIDLSEYYDTDDKVVLEQLTKRFLVEIAKLAGVPDFEPKLAGKNWKKPSETEAAEANGSSPKNSVDAVAGH